MYIYNVTVNIDESVEKEWLQWMKEKHIPAMLATGKFVKAKMTLVMINEEMGGTTYSVQYTTDSLETLQKYYQENATLLQNTTPKQFQNKFVSFSTQLKVVDEQFSLTAKN